MTSYGGAILGIPDQTLAERDLDLEAAVRGPAALDRALARHSPDDLRRLYRACLQIRAADLASRSSRRRHWEDFASHEAAEERAALLRRH